MVKPGYAVVDRFRDPSVIAHPHLTSIEWVVNQTLNVRVISAAAIVRAVVVDKKWSALVGIAPSLGALRKENFVWVHRVDPN